MSPLTWSVIGTVLGLIVIPYNVWLVVNMFDIRTRIAKAEARCNDHVKVLENMDSKLDEARDKLAIVGEAVQFIKGKMEK